MTDPTNKNFLGQNGFQLVIKRLPTARYFTQQVKLPTISIPETSTNDSPFSMIPHPGDRIKWDLFEISFKVDEDMVNYKELHDWIIACGHPHDLAQQKAYTSTGRMKDLISDATLQVLTSHKNVQTQIRFLGMFPINLTGLDFTSTEQDLTFLDATAQFAYLRYEFLS